MAYGTIVAEIVADMIGVGHIVEIILMTTETIGGRVLISVRVT